jgi:pimeloyl-ACP methyl ester carboxylesterase
VLILVHGTGGATADKLNPHWWQSDSQIAKDLAAACADAPAQLSPFTWTGNNSERDRREAGRQLLEKLRKLGSRKYRLIGHSHGGSVIWHALSESTKGEPLKGLGCWITVGTPFLKFQPAWAYLWVVPAAATALVVAWTATELLLQAWPDWMLVMRHTVTFGDTFGLVIRALLTVGLTAIIVVPLSLIADSIVHVLPAWTRMSPRKQAVGAMILIVIMAVSIWCLLASQLWYSATIKGAGILAMPSRCAARLPHLTPHDIGEIDAEVRAALVELGNGG